MMFVSLRQAQRFLTVVFGCTILLVGIVLLVLPGPGIAIILLGLIVLAGEFVWARHVLKRMRTGLQQTERYIRKKVHI